MVGVPVVGGATLRCAVADRPAQIVFVDIDDDYCAVLHRIAAHEGGPTGFGGGNIVVPVPDSIVMRDNPLPENFGDATTARSCIVIAAHEGGPQRFCGRQHNGGGTAHSIVMRDNPLPKNSLWRLLRGVASSMLHMRGELTGVNARRE